MCRSTILLAVKVSLEEGAYRYNFLVSFVSAEPAYRRRYKICTEFWYVLASPAANARGEITRRVTHDTAGKICDEGLNNAASLRRSIKGTLRGMCLRWFPSFSVTRVRIQ